MRKQERADLILKILNRIYPSLPIPLEHKNIFELLVAVLLSAQCTDKRVNIVTPAFFEAFPDANILAKADFDEVFELIRSISYPNNKAKHLIGMAKVLVGSFNNVVPSDVDDLQKMPGVGRKTANVIASVIFDKPTMAVDTHVFRVSNRTGLAYGKNPDEVQKKLYEVVPKKYLKKAGHTILLHGRYTCKARAPSCKTCVIIKYCKYNNKEFR